MEENTEMMEVNEGTTEIADSTESGSMDILSGILIGGGAVLGTIILHKVLKPVVGFAKMKIAAAKEKKQQSTEKSNVDEANSEEEDSED